MARISRVWWLNKGLITLLQINRNAQFSEICEQEGSQLDKARGSLLHHILAQGLVIFLGRLLEVHNFGIEVVDM